MPGAGSFVVAPSMPAVVLRIAKGIDTEGVSLSGPGRPAAVAGLAGAGLAVAGLAGAGLAGAGLAGAGLAGTGLADAGG